MATPAEAMRVWEEITGPIPAWDQITTATVGEGPGDVWVGTASGYIWHSRDGGRTWRESLRPRGHEPYVAPHLGNFRAAALPDLGRVQGSDRNPQDRYGSSRRGADLSGSDAFYQNDRGTPLLGSAVRETARERFGILRITHCQDHTFALTQDGVFRAAPGESQFWQRLPTVDLGSAFWVSCDETLGWVHLNTEDGPVYSPDLGDTWLPWPQVLPIHGAPEVAGLEGGRLLFLKHGVVWAGDDAKDPRGTFHEVCDMRGYSKAQVDMDWAWLYSPARIYAVTADGFLFCSNGVLRTIGDSLTGHQSGEYLWPLENQAVLLATKRAVYLADDAGTSTQLVFSMPTQRSINRIVYLEKQGTLLVFSGGQVFRGTSSAAADATLLPTQEVLGMAQRQAPLAKVVQVALERFEMSPGYLENRRTRSDIRGYMPSIVVAMKYSRGDHRLAMTDRTLWLASMGVQRSTLQQGQDLEYRVFVLWDLSDSVFTRFQTDVSWTQLERLRQRLTYRVQDAYSLWLRQSLALHEKTLTPMQRAAALIAKRRAAAYLHAMTGEHFAVFGPSSFGRSAHHQSVSGRHGSAAWLAHRSP